VSLRSSNKTSRIALLTTALATLMCLCSSAVVADPVSVRHKEGTVRGFLALRSLEGRILASGDLIQTIRGDRVTTQLIFHFKDGSVDDETTVFSQGGTFRLLNYHHVQRGPTFPKPMEVSLDGTTGQFTARASEDGKEKNESQHLDLPPDLANGLTTVLLRNLPRETTETKVSYLAATPKPRIVQLAISKEGSAPFSAAGRRHNATVYRIKIELGGLTGAVAPIVGKQPKDIRVWLLEDRAPAFLRMEAQLYEDGPIWRIEPISLTWPAASQKK
jgi:hypothetical protein